MTLRQIRSAFSRKAEGSAPSLPSGFYSISSRIELKFYVLGIRVCSKRFDALETVTPDRGLLRLALTAEDGNSSVLALLKDDAGLT